MKEDLNVIKNAFPSYLSTNIETLYKNKILQITHHSYESFKVFMNDEILTIPYRVYMNDEDDYNISTEKYILDCYLTRHYDGFIREKHLRNIIRLNKEWVVPYVLKLLGEYVVEILDVIYDELDNLNPLIYSSFIEKNLDFYKNITRGRVGCYYGRFYHSSVRSHRTKQNYSGFKILKFIEKNLR